MTQGSPLPALMYIFITSIKIPVLQQLLSRKYLYLVTSFVGTFLLNLSGVHSLYVLAILISL